MGREPAITFRGALRILGHHDRPWVTRLDRLLGGAILVTGAYTGGAAVVWGWVDQKNEATGLLRGGLDAVSNRLLKTGGLRRHELVIAAHTTMVLAAFWETLSTAMGDQYDETDFSKAERIMLGTGEWRGVDEDLVRHLFDADVPTPSAAHGFEENVELVKAWAEATLLRVDDFLTGLELPFETSGSTGIDEQAGFSDEVTRRYRSDYLQLATTVPEFRVWANTVEHTATRNALSRLETLLDHSTPADDCPRSRTHLREINRAELARPIIDVDIDGYGIDAVFPPVRNIFVAPHYLIGSAGKNSRVGADQWWAENGGERRGDSLEVTLARHFSSAPATQVPLLLLGHPGAGKSLLTKVLAARLPEPTYTVVRVPLRRVDADVNVVEQIRQSLSLTTNGAVSWQELAKECDDTIRVVLLDGLDELLQATTNDRGGYLVDVMDFQRIEAAMGRPVAVVVTSRTLVADRVRLPEGTPVVKLEEFDDTQIADWLDTWNAANPNIAVTSDLMTAHAALARQPLLLLMLALYFADPEVERSIDVLSTSELYERLLDTYARREVTKQAGRVPSDDEYVEGVRTQLARLATAALGMFNRGRQSITEKELSADLTALGESAPEGRRLLGEFFFVHAPEALTTEVHRGYEFLHATFAEYLVATRVVEVLAEVAEGSFGRKRFHDPDDDLLFALLSHEPLAAQRPVLDFVQEKIDSMDVDDRIDVRKTLELLLPAYRGRRELTSENPYRPTPADPVRARATYSANLVTLRLLAENAPLPMSSFFPEDTLMSWRSMTHLWAAGLDAEGHRAVLSTVETDGAGLVRRRSNFHVSIDNVLEADPTFDDPAFDHLNAARLREDHDTARRLLFGHALIDSIAHDGIGGSPHDEIFARLLNLVIGFPMLPPAGAKYMSEHEQKGIADTAFGVVSLHCIRWGADETKEFLGWLMTLPTSVENQHLPLMLAEHVHPGVLHDLALSRNDWTPDWQTAFDMATAEAAAWSDAEVVARYLSTVWQGNWPIDFIQM